MKETLKPIKNRKDKALLKEYNALQETVMEANCIGMDEGIDREILFLSIIGKELIKRGLAI